MSTEDQTNQPKLYPWRPPVSLCSTVEAMEEVYPLMILNSLTRSKVRFIPKDSKTITWYQCGPTVYAESHIGHARTYVGLDIIRRVLKEYLGYNILLCQNVTDIDDKIIIRSSERGINFRELASKYEKEFNEDMAALGVEQPDMSTRVSEYVTEIVDYIQTLINKDIAYESNGSVYFNVSNFEAQGHKYGKLMPEQIGNSELLAEGEGALTANDEKKSASDFVLWKRTKEHVNDGVNEPAWPSPWGPGRPGWHIECSVMSHFAMEKFGGGTLDIHAGGVDLKFPHHENEIAQSEAYGGSHQWVNYWLHMGHLHIKGLKMSKSLKNFITIREALEHHSARQIRFCFLLHKYNMAMDYSDNTMSQAVSIEKIFSEFFHNVKAVLRSLGADSPQHVGPQEVVIMQRVEEVKAAVREQLMDDFDTPRAVSSLVELVGDCNKYMKAGSSGVNDKGVPVLSTVVLVSAARYITSMLKVFGLVSGSGDIGFSSSSSEEGSGVGLSKEQLLAPYLDVLTAFRKDIRIATIAGDNKAVLALVDKLRDEVLPEYGVRMEDKGSGSSAETIWKLEDVEQLRKEKAQKEAEKARKEEEKQKAAKLAAEREERAKVPPSEMFKGCTTEYSAFNEEGLPTLDAAGQPISATVLKKLQKEYSKQKEVHEKYLAKQNK